MRSWSFLLVVTGACTSNLPPAHWVSDLRILAVRAAEPELLFSGLAPAQTRFEALVADPSGAPLSYRWELCPVESEIACVDYDAKRAAADESNRLVLDALRQIGSGGDAVTQPSRPTYDIPAFDLNADPSLVAYHSQASSLGFGAGAWPSVILTVERDGATLAAEKRLVLGIDDGQRTANQNPVFARLQIARGTDSEDFVDVTGDVTVRPGESLRILPEFTDASYEVFQAVRRDLNSHETVIITEREDLSVQWFTSAGDLWNDLTHRLVTKTLDTVLVAPDERPPSGDFFVWLVVRDQRGGVAWQELRVVVSP